jgi:hypothetical protein
MVTQLEAPEALPVEEKTVRAAVEAPQVGFRLAAVGAVKADEVELTNTVAGVVLAAKGATFERAGARTILAGGPVEISRGGAAAIVSAGDVTVARGGAGAVVALGDTHLEQAGAGVVVTGGASVGRGGFVAFALTPRLSVEDGGRVLVGGRAVVGVAVVAAFSVLLGRLLLGARRGRGNASEA